jgi:hypothetical protein
MASSHESRHEEMSLSKAAFRMWCATMTPRAPRRLDAESPGGRAPAAASCEASPNGVLY